jgi:hypothetical protein
MRWDQRYRLLELLEDANPKTFLACEISSGRKVSAFLFIGEPEGIQGELLDRVRGANRLHFPELIEYGEDGGGPYLITQPLSNFSELMQRVNQIKSGAQPVPMAKAEEFSRTEARPVPPPLTSEQSLKEKKADVDRIPAPGEFTQMFQAPAAPMGEPLSETAKTAPSLPPPVPAPSTEPGPGEFTRFFTAVPVPPSSMPMPPAAPQNHSANGEFTRIFGIGSVTVPAPRLEQELFPASTPASAPAIEQRPASLNPPPARMSSSGEFTQIFGSNLLETPAALSDSQSAGHSAPTPAANVPGEYTRMFGAVTIAPAPMDYPTTPATTSVGAESASPQKKQASKLTWVLIGMGVVFLVIVAIAALIIGAK